MPVMSALFMESWVRGGSAAYHRGRSALLDETLLAAAFGVSVPAAVQFQAGFSELQHADPGERLRVPLLRLQGVPDRRARARALPVVGAGGGGRLRVLRQSVHGPALSAESAAFWRAARGGQLPLLVPPNLRRARSLLVRARALCLARARLPRAFR